MSKFEKCYFKDSKVSNYKDYMKKRYACLAEDLIRHFNITSKSKIIDFGCATGNLVYEIKKQSECKIEGTDVSYWAIEQGKKMFKLNRELHFFNVNLLTKPKDYVLFLDVLEHVPTFELNWVLKLAKTKLNNKIIMRVPIAKKEGEPYVYEVSRNDKTHIQCHSANWWINLFKRNGYVLGEKLHLTNIYDSEGVLAATFLPKSRIK